jgi:hypothetical protein
MAVPTSKQTATTKHPANHVELLLREDIILPPWAEVDKKLGLWRGRGKGCCVSKYDQFLKLMSIIHKKE